MVRMTGYMWVTTEGTIATVGLTDEARAQLGDIVYVDLPKVGSTVEQDKEMGTVESVKSVSELVSPLSGTVVEVNTDAEGKGWLIKVKLPGS
jgi:glycine cleavage system H protein